MISPTSERTSSAQLCWRLKNYLKSTIKQDRLNKCLRMHCQKWITTTNHTVMIAKRFPGAKEQRKGNFGKFDHGYLHGCLKMPPPPAPNHVSKRSAASAKEPDFISNGEWEIMVSDGRQQTNSIIWFYRRGLNTAKTRVYEPKIFQARLRTKGLYKNGANWKIRLLRFLNRFFFLKNI